MKRNYNKLVDEMNESNVDFSEIVCDKIKETIEKDSIEDAVGNIWEIITEIKFEF